MGKNFNCLMGNILCFSQACSQVFTCFAQRGLIVFSTCFPTKHYWLVWPWSCLYPIVEDWQNYRNPFIGSVRNTATSSVNKMTNDFIYYYEKGFRANKFGIPAGVFSGGALPEKVEAFYNQNISKALALEGFQAIKNFYNGNGGVSLRQYISEVSTEEYSELSTAILDQFNIAENLINGLDENFYNQILTNNIKVLETYDAIQQGTILLKTDMLSVLQIPTDYVDADGD